MNSNDPPESSAPDAMDASGPRIVIAAVTMLAGLVAGCGANRAPPANGGAPSAAASSEYDTSPLRPGDAIRVDFSMEPDQSGTYRVDPSGEVPLPFLGARTVTETEPALLRKELKSAYDEQLRNQTVEIRLLRRVRVLGAVANPGLYDVDATMSLADLVAEAGGTTPRGSLDDVRIVRDGGSVRTNLEDSRRVFATLESGDHVLVPERSWFARHSSSLIGAGVSVLTFVTGFLVF